MMAGKERKEKVMTYFSRKIEKIKKNLLKTEGVRERRNEEDSQSKE